MSAVRRSCHTIARRGEPRVSRSHSTIVSRWFVMPSAVSSERVDLAEHLAGRLDRRLPDVLGGVLDPARLREVLAELLVALGLDPSVRRDHDGGDAGGARVDREDAHASGPPARRGCSPDPQVDPLRPRARSRRASRSSRPDPHVEAVLAVGLGQRLELDHQRVVDRHPLLGRRRRQVELVEADQAGQLGDGAGVVVDAKVDRDVVVTAVSRPVPHHEQRCRLPTAAVAAGLVAGRRAASSAARANGRHAREQGRAPSPRRPPGPARMLPWMA